MRGSEAMHEVAQSQWLDVCPWQRVLTSLLCSMPITAMVIVTQHGIAIWDCNAVLMPQIVDAIHSLQHVYGNLPLLGIAISHPHFYTTGMTWAKALNTKVIISSSDKEWWQRTRGKRNDDEAQRLVFFDEERYTMAKGLTIVRCGGHFDGST